MSLDEECVVLEERKWGAAGKVFRWCDTNLVPTRVSHFPDVRTEKWGNNCRKGSGQIQRAGMQNGGSLMVEGAAEGVCKQEGFWKIHGIPCV